MTPQPPPPPSAPPTKETSGLAIAAFVLSVVGLFVPCIPSLVGLILGIVALGKLKSAMQAGRGLAIAAVVISGLLLSVTVIGVMAAIAIPNFIRFQARSKQFECKGNLKALYTAERSYYLEHDEYSDDVHTIGFEPEARRRYAYFLSGEGPFLSGQDDAGQGGFHGYLPDMTEVSPADLPPEVAETLGVRGRCPECEFTAACVGQIDSDKTLDVWVISSASTDGPNGQQRQAGQPYNLVNDVEE